MPEYKKMREYTHEEFVNLVKNLSEEELLKLRFKQATGTLENPARIHELRKDVARLKTVLREREIEG